MASYKKEIVQLNGAPVEIMRGGKGRPLLYLHSAAGEMVWMPFHEQLAAHYDLIAPAHPGFSASEGLDRIDNMEDLVIHYLDLLDHLNLPQVDVVGLSLGGWLAAELATRNRERIRRLVLVDAAGLYLKGFDQFEFFQDQVANPGFPAEMRRRCFHDANSEIARAFIPDTIPMDQILMALRARQATARVAWNPYFYNPKLRGRLHRVTMPAMIMWGESDGLLPLDFAREYHRLIPGSELKVMEKCGHLPPIERPAEFAAVVREFLERKI